MPLEPPRARATTHPVLSGWPRQKRSAKIVGLIDQRAHRYRYVAALSAGALSLSILAVAVTCSTCNSKRADTRQALERVDAPISTDAIGPLSSPPSLPVKAETERTDEKLREIDSAIVELEKEPEASLPSAGDTQGTLNTAQPTEHEVRTRIESKHIQRRASARTIVSSSAKYHEVPTWSAKMYDGNWQPKAFPFQQ